MSRAIAHPLLCILFVAVSAGAYLVSGLPSGSRGLGYIALHLVLTAIMFSVWATSRAGGGLRWVVAAGLLARLVLFGAPPFTTHDTTRYLADGAVAAAGVDPYRVSPAAAAIPGWPLPIDNASVVTIYPPAAMGTFVLSTLAGPKAAPWLWKALVTAASLLTVWLGYRLLRARRVEANLALLALSPLLVLESGVGAHVDILATCALTGGLLLSESAPAAGALMGLAALFKPQAGASILPIAVSGARRPALVHLAAAGGLIVAAYGVMLGLGFRPLGSLPLFVQKWRFGSPLFEAGRALVGDSAALLGAFALAALAYLAVLALGRRLGAERAALWGLTVPLLASPVVFPWYLAPLVPVTALRPSAFHLAWLTALPLTYEVIDQFDAGLGWHPAAWPLWLAALGWLLGAAVDGVRWKRGGAESVGALDAPGPNQPVGPEEDSGRLASADHGEC